VIVEEVRQHRLGDLVGIGLAEATPAPSASTAFAISLRASRSSRLSAFAQMLLVIRGRSRFFMIFNSSVSAPLA
jgi:hypothetical protein